ncbi:FG-GAP-like repeat-containing protein [Streptomyces sp. NPDC058326]|uniref:FG-GAP-like repeat-containing protein n=1 Tax=Streptomyces sp. NPDC058326 TaxID=3346447 RepID=UPI0036E4BEBA
MHLSSTRRLAAAVTAVLAVTTVTAVTGTLVTAPAFAAVPAAVPATAAEANLPLDAEVVSTGTTGYLTSRHDEEGNTVLEWHKYSDGSIVPVSTGLSTRVHDSNSDIVVTSSGGAVWLRDMRSGASFSTYIDLYSEFRASSELVGAVGGNLYVSVSVPNTDGYRELWKLAKVNGVSQKSKLSSRTRNTDYKVVASDGNNLIVLGTEMTRSTPASAYRPSWWRATTSALSNSVIDWEGSYGTYRWTQSSTGAYTTAHQAWVQYPEDEGVVIAAGSKRFVMDSSMSGVVVAGIVGDILLYGVPGTTAGEPPSPLYARSLTDATAAPYKVLDNFSSVAHAPDGAVLVRGFSGAGDGIFRIVPGPDGHPDVMLTADTGRVMSLQVTGSKVPASVNLEKPGTTVPMEWTLSRTNATANLTLTHTATGRKLTQRLSPPGPAGTVAFSWNGLLDGVSAPNGAYTWQITATRADGLGSPATASGRVQVSRQANPHDFNDNGSTDVLARDASGVLWRDDLFDWPSGSQVTTAKRTRVGTGWNTYKQIEAVGNIAGSAHGDLLALDTSGYLWHYLGKSDGTLSTRVRIGGGWGGYTKLTGGSDLTGDGRADLLATDTSGALWFYKGTGSTTAPFATRVRVGGGWGIYNQLTAVGNIAGSSAGDLVARDTAGVLWLYQGNGTGGFATRVRVGSGWGAFSQLVGAGDVNADGRPDLIAYGAGGTYVYRSTGSALTPFSRMTTNLYAGEGSKFTSVS